MENASRALLIAGAILLILLIIGLAVFVYNQASNTVNDTGMDQVVAREFNSQFEPYINRNIGASTVRALIDTVESNNRTSNNNVVLDGITDKNQVKMGHKYTTETLYRDGVISGIIICDTDGSTETGNPTTGDDEIPGGGGNSSGDDGGISAEALEFNSQFRYYVPHIDPFVNPPILIFYKAGVEHLIRIVQDSNDNNRRQVILETPDNLQDVEYTSSVIFDENGYITNITVFEYIERIKR